MIFPQYIKYMRSFNYLPAGDGKHMGTSLSIISVSPEEFIG